MQRGSAYLYLFERTSGRSLWAILSFQHEVKIGIATDVQARLSSVRATTRGQIECIFSWRFGGASARIERRLHHIFGDSRFRIKGKGKKTNGETEWFYMSFLELLLLYGWLGWFIVRGWVWLAAIAWLSWRILN